MGTKICLRCGYCCQTCLVAIVIDPDKGPQKGNWRAINTLEEPCPYLEGDRAGEYSCSIHDREWFPGTACGQHNGFISGKDAPCPMGEYVLGKAGCRVSVICPGCRGQQLVPPADRMKAILSACPECGHLCHKEDVMEEG